MIRRGMMITMGLWVLALTVSASGSVMDIRYTQNGGAEPSGHPSGWALDDGSRRLLEVNNHITDNSAVLGDNPADAYAPASPVGEILDTGNREYRETFDRLAAFKTLQLLWYAEAIRPQEAIVEFIEPPYIAADFFVPGSFNDSTPRGSTTPPTPGPPIVPEPMSLVTLAAASLAALCRRPAKKANAQ